VPAFRLLSAADRPSWIIRSGAKVLSTFVGREQERAELSAALERAAAGRAQSVALVADAGMGKSRLLHQFLEDLVPGAGPGAGQVRDKTPGMSMRVETTAQTMAIPYALITAAPARVRRLLAGRFHRRGGDPLPSVLASLGLEAGSTRRPCSPISTATWRMPASK
jgi:hypothetical protein